MIAVIADDFTGAAEIGGIGLRHGLKVVIETEPVNGNNADLLIIATDTRSMNSNDAMEKIKSVTTALLKMGPDFVYKKVDSVLRGNVKDELRAQMEISGLKKALIIAANPVFKRTIKSGDYFIDDTPLNETNFATDPLHPVKSANVVEILGNEKQIPVYNKKVKEKLPDRGIIVGDVETLDDLKAWAGIDKKNILIAGASGFFNALIETLVPIKHFNGVHKKPVAKKSLFVLGSTYPKESDFFKGIKEQGCYISNMPVELFMNKEADPLLLRSWANDITNALNNRYKVVMCIDHPLSFEAGIGVRINETIGNVVKKVLQKTVLEELYVEGGSTTFIILEKLGIKKLIPLEELDTGVIRMQAESEWGFTLTTKPGSYSWPKKVWITEDAVKINNINFD